MEASSARGSPVVIHGCFFWLQASHRGAVGRIVQSIEDSRLQSFRAASDLLANFAIPCDPLHAPRPTRPRTRVTSEQRCLGEVLVLESPPYKHPGRSARGLGQSAAECCSPRLRTRVMMCHVVSCRQDVESTVVAALKGSACWAEVTVVAASSQVKALGRAPFCTRSAAPPQVRNYNEQLRLEFRLEEGPQSAAGPSVSKPRQKRVQQRHQATLLQSQQILVCSCWDILGTSKHGLDCCGQANIGVMGSRDHLIQANGGPLPARGLAPCIGPVGRLKWFSFAWFHVLRLRLWIRWCWAYPLNNCWLLAVHVG